MPNPRRKTRALIRADMSYENKILGNPQSAENWLNYIDYLKKKKRRKLNVLFEAALDQVPESYELWDRYLDELIQQLDGLYALDPAFDAVEKTFETALRYLEQEPRIWIKYCKFMIGRHYIGRTQRVFDRALMTLPKSQHNQIWPMYLDFAKKRCSEMAILLIFQRYIKVAPEDTEDYIEYLLSIGKVNEAAAMLLKIANQNNFVSKRGKSKCQMWIELCALISKNPSKIQSLNVDAVIRQALKRCPDQAVPLWNSLADFYVRSGSIEKARKIYEEAFKAVKTQKEFTQIFNAYTQLEQLSYNECSKEILKDEVLNEEDDSASRPRLRNSRQAIRSVRRWWRSKSSKIRDVFSTWYYGGQRNFEEPHFDF